MNITKVITTIFILLLLSLGAVFLYSKYQDSKDYFIYKGANGDYRIDIFLTGNQTDYYVYFIERSIHLLKSYGKLSYIVSDSWLNSDYFTLIRNELLSKHRVEKIAVFDYAVFDKVTLENSIFIIEKTGKTRDIEIVRFKEPNKFEVVNSINPQDAIKEGLINPYKSGVTDQLLQKIDVNSKPLNTIVRINRGLHAYRTDGYGMSKFGNGFQSEKDKELQSYHAVKKLDNTYLPEIKGKDVDRYSFNLSGKFGYLHNNSWISSIDLLTFGYKVLQVSLRATIDSFLNADMTIDLKGDPFSNINLDPFSLL